MSYPYMIRIESPYFCAGIVMVDGRCRRAAPILKWTVGRYERQLTRYFSNRGWVWQKL